jgi:hypothetical protein
MSYLLSSVDPVLNCDTNGPAHAPAILSLAPSTGSMFASSIGSLQSARFLVFASQREWCIHCLCCGSLPQQQLRCGSLPLYFDHINSGDQFN